jgi:NDP-sugar pyrophosphorylase family protein
MLNLYQEHVSQRRQFTIAASERTNIVDYGVLHARENRLTGFEEKPKFNYLVSMGVYILNRSVLDRVPAGQKYGFDDLMLDMLAHNEFVHVERHSGYWLDIGRVDDYMRAVDEFEDRQKQLLPNER